ncbi:ShlB/FhaC/HecB family hemolysin secretion/activation protein (plasmid) [Paraburkholderia sp. PREW-6R]|uniref:ShlB/FhaC/HecB family hemolysin secretion/activation protein n=1 Tax=Paraburkholderia sp. PREW-6R TaxID=3141544 RepID=UPI0031F59D5B
MYERKRLRRLACALVALACGVKQGYAQTVGPDIRLQLERQGQLQQQQLDRDRSLQNGDANPFRTPTPAPEAVVPPVTHGPAGECHQYRQIRIDGADHLRPIYRDALIAPFLGRCLSQQDAESLAAAITRHYLEDGYVTTHAYVRRPDPLAPDVLSISVVEGILERYAVEGSSIPLSTVFPMTVGHIFNLRDLEEGIDHLNALASNNVTAQIEPGAAAGGSVVRLQNQRTQAPWRAYFSVDTLGNSATGRAEGVAGLTLDNPLGLADSLSTSMRRSSPWNPQPYRSFSFSTLYNIPFGYNDFTVGYQTSRYSQTLTLPSGSAVKTDGTLGSLFIKGERLLYRDQNTQLVVSGQLRAERDSTSFGAQELALQSPHLAVFDGDVIVKRRVENGWLQASLGLSEGLHGLDATIDSGNTGPRAQYTVFHSVGSATTQFAIGAQQFTYSASYSGQWSQDQLYPSSQMLIGGPYTVRGFDRNTASGSTGVYMRNELGWLSHGSVWGMPTLLSPYIGLDAGRIWRANSATDTSVTLIGTTVGVRYSAGRISLDAFYSAPAPWLKFVPREKGLVYLQATFNL